MEIPHNYPDGLTLAVIEALVAEVDAVARPVHRVPRPFADRDAALRRERRRASRALTRVVRSLPPLTPSTAEGGEAA
jgi:hypothetical protein